MSNEEVTETEEPVIEQQDAIFVFTNKFGSISIEQKSYPGIDNIIVLKKSNAKSIAEAILAEAEK